MTIHVASARAVCKGEDGAGCEGPDGEACRGCEFEGSFCLIALGVLFFFPVMTIISIAVQVGSVFMFSAFVLYAAFFLSFMG